MNYTEKYIDTLVKPYIKGIKAEKVPLLWLKYGGKYAFVQLNSRGKKEYPQLMGNTFDYDELCRIAAEGLDVFYCTDIMQNIIPLKKLYKKFGSFSNPA